MSEAVVATSNGLPSAKGGARPVAAGSWKATFAGGIFKLLLAGFALTPPFFERSLPLWVGGMLLAGGLAELTVGWTKRHSIVGKIGLGSGIMTVLVGLLFMAALRMGLGQLTVLTIAWLGLRSLISVGLAFQSRATRVVTRMLLLRGGTDLVLGLTLIAGLSVTQIARLLFGDSAAMSAGFLVIIAVSFAVAGFALIAIALSELRGELSHETGRARTDPPVATPARLPRTPSRLGFIL